MAYEIGRPYAFTQQQGNGDLALLEKQVGAYIKDDWQMRPGLSIGYGVRYDWQNYFHDTNNVAPRVSHRLMRRATGKANVLRAGVGVFNDRSGPVVIADVLHSQPGGLTTVVDHRSRISRSIRVSGGRHRASRRAIVQLAPDVQIPQSVQYSAGLEHQLQKTTTVSLSYTGARGILPVSIARHQCAAAAAVSGAARSCATARFARSSRTAGRPATRSAVTLRGPHDDAGSTARRNTR